MGNREHATLAREIGWRKRFRTSREHREFAKQNSQCAPRLITDAVHSALRRARRSAPIILPNHRQSLACKIRHLGQVVRRTDETRRGKLLSSSAQPNDSIHLRGDVQCRRRDLLVAATRPSRCIGLCSSATSPHTSARRFVLVFSLESPRRRVAMVVPRQRRERHPRAPQLG